MISNLTNQKLQHCFLASDWLRFGTFSSKIPHSTTVFETVSCYPVSINLRSNGWCFIQLARDFLYKTRGYLISFGCKWMRVGEYKM